MKKNLFKKVGLGVLAAGLVLGLSACGKKESSSDKVSINVFQFKVEFKKQFQDAAKQYMKENPNVKIDITTVGGGSDYGAALKSKFQSGNEPNIFNIGGPEDTKTWKKYLADVSSTKAAKAALDGTLDGVEIDGKAHALPYDIEGIGLLYNKAIFEKAGIDATKIKTLDDLEAAASKLNEQKDALGIDAPIAYPTKETWVTGLHSSNPFLAAEFGNSATKAYNAKEVSFKYGKEFKQYVDISTKYSVKPTNSMDYSQQVEKLFSNGKVAIIQQGNWVYPTIAGINKDMAQNDVGIIPIPVNKATEGKMAVGTPNYWAVNKKASAKQVKASKDFLDWLYTSKSGKNIVLTKLNFVPAYKGYDTAKIADPLSKTVYDYYKKGDTTGWVFMGYPTDWGQNVLGAGIQKYAGGDTSWDAMVKDTKAQWKSSRE